LLSLTFSNLFISSFSFILAGVSVDQVPVGVQDALTRDYSGLMKAINKKKKGEDNFRP